MKRCLTLLLALVLALSLAACGAKSAGSDTMTGDYNGYESAKEDYDFSATDDEAEDAGAWNGDGQVGSGIDKSLSERGVKMIYSAHIEMQTLSYEQAVEDIAALVERSGAYFEQKNFSNYSSGYRHASYTVRVPAEQFADFCAQVGTLCHVTWQDDSAENISEQYYDTQSRLETAQIKLARLQELLKKAENMEDIITIESAISETEYEIERLSGTMRHYDALVDYATVTLELNEVYRLSGTEDAPKSFGEKLSNAFTDGLAAVAEGLEDFAIWLAYSWLGILIFAAVVFAAVKLIGRLRRGQKLPKIGRKKTIQGGVILLAVCFASAYFLTTHYQSINAVMFVVFALVGLAWAAINVNSLPMVVEMCKGSDIGKFTGYYYTFSMAAQVVTPILAGTLLKHISYSVLFPYAAFFVACSFVTMCFVRHGDCKVEAKAGLAAFEVMDAD